MITVPAAKPKRPMLSILALALLLAVPVLGAEQAKPFTAVLQPLVDKGELAGAVVLAADKEKVLAEETVGWADVEARTPMRTDALFWIASMSKPLTGTGLMMLVDEGKLSLDDPVEKYLPEFKTQMVIAEKSADHLLLKKPAKPITVRNVMSHTSGLPFLGPFEPRIDMFPLRERCLAYSLLPLNSQPGTKYAYSNCGIDTGGRIIEVVSGLGYADFMDQRLFKPLGMKDTTLWPSDEQIARLPKCYKSGPKGKGLLQTPMPFMTYPLTDRRRTVSPGGGYFSTASDLAIFGRMILGGGVWQGKRYLSEAAIKQMTAKQTGELPQHYGVGWAVDAKGEGFGHGGACATQIWIDTKRGLVTIFMVQAQGFPGEGGKSWPLSRQAAETLRE